VSGGKKISGGVCEKKISDLAKKFEISFKIRSAFKNIPGYVLSQKNLRDVACHDNEKL